MTVETVTGRVMLKASEFVVSPPGRDTEMAKVPNVEVLKIRVSSSVGLTNVVRSGWPFHVTDDPLTNPVPITLSVKGGLLATTEEGTRLVMAGAVTVTVTVPVERLKLELPP